LYIIANSLINPVRNFSGTLNPALRGGTPYGVEPGIILKSTPAAAAGPGSAPASGSESPLSELECSPSRKPARREGLLPRREQPGIISNGVKVLVWKILLPLFLQQVKGPG